MAASEMIGERLRRLREERGLTQRAISMPGVSPQYISKVERGERAPSVKALRKLATTLGVSAQFLETGHDLADAEVRDFGLDEADLALRLGEDPQQVESALLVLLDEAVAAGDTRAATRARLSLGAVASHRGDHAAAVTRLEAALREPWVTPLAQPDAFASLGHSYAASGRGRDAVALFRSCLETIVGRRPIDAAAAARFATYLSYALADLGLLDEAREAVDVALRHGRGTGDPYTAIRLHWSSARLAAATGDLDLGRLHANRAIGLLETTEDTTNLARAHLLAAEIRLSDGDETAAGEHLDAAARLLPEGAAAEDRACLLVQQSFAAARSGDAPAAIDAANQAIRILDAGEDPSIRGRAHWALGEAYAAAGAAEAARAAFVAAGELIPPGSKHATTLLEAWQRAVPSDVG